MQTVNSTNFHQALRDLIQQARTDKRLTPSAQLLYRVLLDFANRNFWTYPFVASRDELKEVTHYTSNQDIDNAKRRLKNIGLIDFNGHPSKFTVYCPLGSTQGGEQGGQADNFNTAILKDKTTKKENFKRKKGEGRDDDNGNNVQHNGANADITLQTAEASEAERLEQLIAELREREERNRPGTRRLQELQQP